MILKRFSLLIGQNDVCYGVTQIFFINFNLILINVLKMYHSVIWVCPWVGSCWARLLGDIQSFLVQYCSLHGSTECLVTLGEDLSDISTDRWALICWFGLHHVSQLYFKRSKFITEKSHLIDLTELNWFMEVHFLCHFRQHNQKRFNWKNTFYTSKVTVIEHYNKAITESFKFLFQNVFIFMNSFNKMKAVFSLRKLC